MDFIDEAKQMLGPRLLIENNSLRDMAPGPKTRPAVENGSGGSFSRTQFPAHVLPGDCETGILQVFGPTPVEFVLLLGRQRHLRPALRIRETVPETHRQLRALVRRELEEFGKRARRHDCILSRG
jgi:hypothetical protein